MNQQQYHILIIILFCFIVFGFIVGFFLWLKYQSTLKKLRESIKKENKNFKQVKSLTFNYRVTGNIATGLIDNWTVYEVGKDQCIMIIEDGPNLISNQFSYLVYFENTDFIVRVFGPNNVQYL